MQVKDSLGDAVGDLHALSRDQLGQILQRGHKLQLPAELGAEREEAKEEQMEGGGGRGGDRRSRGE